MKRLLARCAVSVMMLMTVPASALGTDATVGRAAFLERAVEALYGAAGEKYSVPFVSVPESARGAVGLARALNALHGWKDGWDAPVSRGEALEVLFDLSRVVPGAFGEADFSDVRGRGARRAARQAIAWDLLQPLTRSHFGWSRAVHPDELDAMLDRIGTRVTAPLAAPAADAPSSIRPPGRLRNRGGMQDTAPKQPRARGRAAQPPPSKRTITIDIPTLDRGTRRAGFNRLELPRSDLLETLWGLIQWKFLYQDRIDESELPYALAESMMGILNDPYSTFMRPQGTESFQQQIHGELSGIGAQVQLHPMGGVEVVTPLTGSPALRAGIRPGDRITQVNGESIVKLNLTDAVMKIRGPVGSSVILTVERGGGTLVFTVVRETINIPEITVTRQEGTVIVKLFQFGEKTRSSLRGMIEDAISADTSGVILDLRNNPGGLLDAAVDVASHVLPEGSVVAQIRSNDGVRMETVHLGGPVVPANLPVIVIVNAGSASASEIVAGALQDHGRATIIGEKKTFGKGTVQEVVQFTTGESAKMTIAEWMTPNGRSIEGTGITPDIVMEDGSAEARDEMLLRALQIIRTTGRR